MNPQTDNGPEQTNGNPFDTQQIIGLQPEQPVSKRRFSKKMIMVLISILLGIVLVILGVIEYIKVNKFNNSINTMKTSVSYKSYIDEIGVFTDSTNSLYYDLRTCSIDSSNKLWDFDKPKDSKYSYPDFSMIYTATENNLRAKHEEVKKLIPEDYKKGFMSSVMPGLNNSIKKRQNVVKLQEVVDEIFKPNKYMSYCRNDIYNNVVDRLRFIKSNADGSNTVVPGADTVAMKKSVDDMLKMFTATPAPQDFNASRLEFTGILTAISNTYTKVSAQSTSTASVSSNKQEFVAHKDRLDKSLKNLVSIAQKHNDLQKTAISQALDLAR